MREYTNMGAVKKQMFCNKCGGLKAKYITEYAEMLATSMHFSGGSFPGFTEACVCKTKKNKSAK